MSIDAKTATSPAGRRPSAEWYRIGGRPDEQILTAVSATRDPLDWSSGSSARRVQTRHGQLWSSLTAKESPIAFHQAQATGQYYETGAGLRRIDDAKSTAINGTPATA